MALSVVWPTVATANQRTDTKNCSDFRTWQEGQAFFLSVGGPRLDPNHLDRDHDGIACESLPGAPTPVGAAPAPTATPRRAIAAPTIAVTASTGGTVTAGTAEPVSTPPTSSAPETVPPTLERTARPTRTPRPTATADSAPAPDRPATPTAAPTAGELPAAVPTRDASPPSPPARLWALVLSATAMVSDADEVLTTSAPGAWLLVLDVADGWLLVASPDGGTTGWVRADSRVQIVPEWAPVSPPADVPR